MSTVRVDLTSSSGRSAHVDRTLPALLEGHMTRSDWAVLSQKLERVVTPLYRLKNALPCVLAGLFVVTIIIFAATFTNFSGGDDISGGPPIGAFVLVPILWVTVIIASYVYGSRAASKAMEQLQQICAEESSKYASLSFHTKEERFPVYYGAMYGHHGAGGGGGYQSQLYVEILVNPRNSITTACDGVVESIPVATAQQVFCDPEIAVAPSAPLASVAERLEELDQIKDRLSTFEFERKRMEILDSL